ncbi:MAG TPA: metalloregulator ArsR/SmtB family transcription factor [Massilibacterium sp.]|nr:metalloregulator ArsR/SmtB family transcription factor [Massilibacterium sp.]
MGKSHSTREEILHLLKHDVEMTVTQLANELGITEMAVRRHLNALEKDGYVETTLIRQAMGRPLHIYFLTDLGHELFPRQYDQLSLTLLEELEDMLSRDVVRQLFEKRQQGMIDTYKKKLRRLQSKEEKIQALAEIQDENGYMVEVEEKIDGTVHIRQYNCPISKVAKNYKEACSCEMKLYRDILETEKVECKSRLSDGDACCEYIVK